MSVVPAAPGTTKPVISGHMAHGPVCSAVSNSPATGENGAVQAASSVQPPAAAGARAVPAPASHA
jgi:hypothetical protein